jgi:hypothetical protein
VSRAPEFVVTRPNGLGTRTVAAAWRTYYIERRWSSKSKRRGGGKYAIFALVTTDGRTLAHGDYREVLAYARGIHRGEHPPE